MKISVIIVSWNAKSFLLQCLESVLPQSSPDLTEVIVVDNASTDGSPQAVGSHYPTVKLIWNGGNDGFAKGNNIGIRASRGEYLFLINSDVVVSQGCFGKLVAYMDAHPEVGILGPKIIGSDGKVQRSTMGYPSLWNTLCRALALDSMFPSSKLVGGHLMTFWNHDVTQAVEVINGCFWVVRRAAMEQVGLLDERFFMYGEDVDWCKRFAEARWEVVFLSEVDVLHYGGASSANAPVKFNVEMQRANSQYWSKHHSRRAAHAFLLISLLHHGLRVAGEIATYPFRRTTASKFKIRRGIEAIKWIVGNMERAL
jgi:GT2 family glycosyltransferase